MRPRNALSSDLAADNIFSVEGGVCGTVQHRGYLTAQLSPLNNMAQHHGTSAQNIARQHLKIILGNIF